MVHIDPTVINKVMARRTGRGFQWKGVNTHFGEFVIKLRESENIPEEIIVRARNQPGIWHPLPAGHKRNLDDFKGDKNDYEDISTFIPDIPEHLSTRDEEKKGQCQLFAAALLINIDDLKGARYLIQKSQTLSPQSLAYKYLLKGGVFPEFLRINTNYTILKVKKRNCWKSNIYHIYKIGT